METTIIKIGNSLGSRYSKAYLEKLGLKEGDRIEVTIHKKEPDYTKAIKALEKLSKMNGAFQNIKDPVAWQRQQRKQWDDREKRLHDIA